jgi:hypothetical protein
MHPRKRVGEGDCAAHMRVVHFKHLIRTTSNLGRLVLSASSVALWLSHCLCVLILQAVSPQAVVISHKVATFLPRLHTVHGNMVASIPRCNSRYRMPLHCATFLLACLFCSALALPHNPLPDDDPSSLASQQQPSSDTSDAGQSSDLYALSEQQRQQAVAVTPTASDSSRWPVQGPVGGESRQANAAAFMPGAYPSDFAGPGQQRIQDGASSATTPPCSDLPFEQCRVELGCLYDAVVGVCRSYSAYLPVRTTAFCASYLRHTTVEALQPVTSLNLVPVSGFQILSVDLPSCPVLVTWWRCRRLHVDAALPSNCKQTAQAGPGPVSTGAPSGDQQPTVSMPEVDQDAQVNQSVTWDNSSAQNLSGKRQPLRNHSMCSYAVRTDGDTSLQHSRNYRLQGRRLSLWHQQAILPLHSPTRLSQVFDSNQPSQPSGQH